MALTIFQPPTYQQLLQALINDYVSATAYYGYNNGLGLTVDPGSEIYLRFSAQAGQRAVFYQLMNVLVNGKLIDTATGSDLDRVANDFGLQRRGATNSQGFIQLTSSLPITLNVGTILTGPNSLQYQVAQYGVYNPQSNIQVASVDQGSSTNLPIGAIMSWQSPQANMQSTCLVSVSLTGGINAEDDATLRNRIYLSLQSPPQMGNGQQLVSLAGSVDGIVQQAFVYSNFNGAGTQLIALTGYQTTSYIGRDIPHLLTDGYVKPYGVLGLQPGLIAQPFTNGPYNIYSYPNGGDAGNFGQNLSADTSAIYGQLPGGVANPYATVITTVNNTPSSIAAVLTLPYPVGSAINGFGNGWTDSVPWPNPDGYYVKNYCAVTSVQGTGTTIGGQTGFGITISAPSSGTYHTNPPFVSYLNYSNNTPTPGQTHIQWVNRSDFQDTGWLVTTATILGATDNGNDTWSITLDTPLEFGTDGYDFYGNSGIAVGDFIFPASINAQNYLDGVLINYAILGPGQSTSSEGLLTLGASRYPSPNAQFPNVMGVQVERFLVTNNQEVYAASVNPNSSGAYNTAYNPPAVNAPPNIYVPQNLGFYPDEFYNFGL